MTRSYSIESPGIAMTRRSTRLSALLVLATLSVSPVAAERGGRGRGDFRPSAGVQSFGQRDVRRVVALGFSRKRQTSGDVGVRCAAESVAQRQNGVFPVANDIVSITPA